MKLLIRFGICGLAIALSACASRLQGDIITGEIVAEDWRMPVARGYDAFYDHTVYSIQKDRMVGTFQISAVSKSRGEVTEADLQKLAAPFLRNRPKLQRLDSHDLGFHTDFSDNGVYWKAWYFGFDNTGVFVTYSAYDRELNRVELDEVVAMVNNLTATGS
ncbi:MAG: hypothetical protein AAF499_00290 [Pseudomonadota bacterium]